MAKQTLVWTALPNGYSEDGDFLRVSALVSPRLEPEADAPQLSTFPDFISASDDWPATLLSSRFVVILGGNSVTVNGNDFAGQSRVDTSKGQADSASWRALFTELTPVEGFAFRDLSNHPVLSYPTANMDALVRNLYTRLAATATDQLPTATEILSHAEWSDLVEDVRRDDYDDRFMNFDLGIRDPEKQFDFFRKKNFNQLSPMRKDLALFQLYHTPASKPRVDKYSVGPDDPRSRANWLGYERTDLPKKAEFAKENDFHKIVAAMNQYPTLLRRLGLVVDLLIARDAFTPTPNSDLSIIVELPPGAPGVVRAPDVPPRTLTVLDANRFQALPRPGPKPGDYRLEDGLLDLSPNQFDILQTDVDGSSMKLINFARSLGMHQAAPDKSIDPTTKKERQTGAPSLRNAGWMLVHKERGAMLENSFGRQKKLDDALKNQQQPDLFAEDLVRGWRIDIWDSKPAEWRSLCRRIAKYNLNAGDVTFVVNEEGTVKLAATTTPDKTSNPDLVWLHEALISWTGWSLCAKPPGRTIHHVRDEVDPAKDHGDAVGDSEPEVPPGIRLETSYTAEPGTLPRLRYGRKYWIRARAVDLAGNSLPLQPNDYGPENSEQNARLYLRYDPILPPALALLKNPPNTLETPAEGESMERIAIRTFNDTPLQNNIATSQEAHRVAVPDRTNHREAEQHGMLDKSGAVDAAFFAMLATKDFSLDEEKVLQAGPLSESGPVEVGYAVMRDGDPLPYLPDPLAVQVVARIFDHPDIPATKLIPIPLYPSGKAWPDAQPFKIELVENPGEPPHWEETTRTLRVPLPKAERATLRLSIRPSRQALELLGVWDWLNPSQKQAVEQMALNGQHWMLTPWRNVELVHAVQKPLITPEILKHSIDRQFGSTYALPNVVATCSIKSTDHIDLLAEWNEPFEDIALPASGVNRPRTDHAFGVKITDAKTYNSQHEYHLEATDVVRFGGFFHDMIGQKIHEFHDTRYRRIEYSLSATSKFREFMPAGLLTETVGTETVPTEKNIQVVGPKVRTWIPSSAPPPAPDVLYVVPTFGWVRSFGGPDKSSWRRGGGLRVYLDRPWNASGYGEMLAVVLHSSALTADANSSPAAQPVKNFVTQWGNDPIWLSPFVQGNSPTRANFPLARLAADPAGAWLPDYAPAVEADQPPGPFTVTNLQHPGLKIADPQALVEVAPHDVFFDPERQLWYCDIEVNFGTSYFPFIRLALARYQPGALSGAHLSSVVLADFMPLVPDRWLNVSQTASERTKHVRVFGHTYEDSSSHQEAIHAPAMSVEHIDGTFSTLQAPHVEESSVVEVWVERLDTALGEDFGWVRETDAVVQKSGEGTFLPEISVRPNVVARSKARAMKLLKHREYAAMVDEKLLSHIYVTPVLWDGSVTIPQAPGGQTRYRLVIAEYEEYLVDDAYPYDKIPTRKERRLVFVEHVELT